MGSVARIHQHQWHAGALEPPEFFGNDRVLAAEIAQQHHGVHPLQPRFHGGRFQRGRLVRLAGHAPFGREIHQHDPALGTGGGADNVRSDRRQKGRLMVRPRSPWELNGYSAMAGSSMRNQWRFDMANLGPFTTRP